MPTIDLTEIGVDWRVFSKDETVMVEPLLRPQRREQTPAKRSDFSGDPLALKVDDGWLVGRNRGEFGGTLAWYSSDGKRSYLLSATENVNGFIRAGGSLFVYEGLAHLSSNRGTIKCIKRNAAGTWGQEPFVTLHEDPRVALLDADDAMLVVTWSSVVKVWPSGKMKLLLKGESLAESGVFYPRWCGANSAVLARDDTLYIGATQEVVRISSLHANPKIEHIVCGTKAKADAEAITGKFFADYASDMKSKNASVRQRAVQRMGRVGARDAPPDAAESAREYERVFTGTDRYDAAVALMPALKDESAAVAVEAARALGRVGHVVSAEPLAKAIEDPRSEVAVMAAWALGRLAGDQLPGLLKGLKSAEAAVALQSCRSLGELGGRATAALPALRDLVRDSRRAVQTAATAAIQQIAAAANVHVATLNDPGSDSDARKAAAWELAQMGAASDQVMPALVRALDDRDASVRSDAAFALGRIGPPAAKDAGAALVKAFTDKNSHVAGVAAEAAARMGPAMLPPLVAAMRSDAPAARMGAADAFFWMECPPKDVVPELVRLLDDKAVAVRQRAARALEHLGKQAMPAAGRLIELMNDPDKEVRCHVIGALGRIGPSDERVLPALNGAIHSVDRDTRSAAFFALRSMRPRTPAVESGIVDAITNDEELIRECRNTELGKLGRSLPKVIPALVRAAEKKLSWELAWAFGEIGHEAATAVPVLIEGLKSADDDVRLAAARSLGQIGPRAAPAVPALAAAAESRDLRLVILADEAMTRIGNPAQEGAKQP